GSTDGLIPAHLRRRGAPDRRAAAAPQAAAAHPPRRPAMRYERFDTPGSVRLDLSVPAGEIDVRTEDGAETTVDLEPLRENDASRGAAEAARIHVGERAA